MDRSHAERILLTYGWLSRQPEAFQLALLRKARLVSFDKGDHVYTAGDTSGGIFGVSSGAFAVDIMTAHAPPHLAHIMRAGGWTGTGPVLSGEPRAVTFRALESSHALQVPIAALTELSNQDGSTFRRLGALSDELTKIAIHAVRDLLISTPDRRLAAVLLRITGATTSGSTPPLYQVQVTQAELGELANLARESVNRVMSRLKERGWVGSRYSHVQILDAPALIAFAYTFADRE